MKTIEYKLERVPTMKVTERGTGKPLMPRALQDFRMLGLGLSRDGNSKSMICYDPTEDSIYLNEHRNPDPNKKTIESIRFEYFRNRMTFSGDDDLKKQFMDAWLYNKDAKGHEGSGIRPLFSQVDHEAIADAATRSEQLEDQAKSLVWGATDDQILAYASYKGVRVEGGMKSLRRTIRNMISFVGSQKFMDEFNSDMVKRSFIFKNLIEDGDLKNDTTARVIKWARSGDPIVSYGSQDPIEALVNHSLRGEGASFWGVIEREYTEDEVEMEKIGKKESAATMSNGFDMEVSKMVDMAIENKTIKEGKNGGYYFGGSKCGQTVEATVTHIKDRPEKVNLLKEELGLV